MNELIRTQTSGKRFVLDTRLFDDPNCDWEVLYQTNMDVKYKKGIRKFSTEIKGIPQKEPLIFLVPRERTKSYLAVELAGVDKKDVQYAAISKGFAMNDLSSFSLGPIPGEGLCLVNAAFSKQICIGHIEGGGIVNLKRKNYWQRSKKPTYNIQYINEVQMKVDDIIVNIHKWLKEHENEWFPQWELWRRSISLCSKGDFHWDDKMDATISYRYNMEYLTFIQWKKQCYITPAYDLLPHIPAFQFLQQCYDLKIPLGLVHPKSILNTAEQPITKEELRQLFDDPYEISCLPYCIVGKLMNVSIY